MSKHFPLPDGFIPDFYNGAEVARRAAEHQKTRTARQSENATNRARKPQVARELSEDEAFRFREAGQQIVLPGWN